MHLEKQYYKIILEGFVNLDWLTLLDEAAIQQSEDGHTVITGAVPDQTALHGVLMRIRDLGISLIEIKRIKNSQETRGE